MFDLALEGRAARLILARPDRRNAIPADGWIGLAETAEAAVARGARLLLLAGSGSAFCAGADLSDFSAMHGREEAAARFREAMRGGIERLAALPVPTLALIDGACFGAGVALAMACDLRIAGPSAAFAITPAKYGISYPQEDIARLVALIGPGQAARMLLGAVTLDAAEAARVGLIEILAGTSAEDAATPLVEAILSNSRGSLAALKRGLRLAATADAEQDRLFDTLLSGDELAERLDRMRGR
jgi:enoyl-CoA hydratase/carnithine racemase